MWCCAAESGAPWLPIHLQNESMPNSAQDSARLRNIVLKHKKGNPLNRKELSRQIDIERYVLRNSWRHSPARGQHPLCIRRFVTTCHASCETTCHGMLAFHDDLQRKPNPCDLCCSRGQRPTAPRNTESEPGTLTV